MKKILAFVLLFALAGGTACSQSSITGTNVYMLNQMYFLNKAGTGFLTGLTRSTALTEAVYTLDYMNQVKFRNTTAYTLTLSVPSSLDLSWTLTLPDSLPPGANSVMVFNASGTATFALGAYIGTTAFSSTWDGKDTVVTQNQVYDVVNPLRTQTKEFTVLDTVKTGGETVWAWKVPYAITITEIASHTDANTVTFNIEQRAETTPNTAGTDCMSSDQVADNDQQETTSFADATVPANYWLVCVVSAAGDVTRFCVTIRYTID